ncbi:MAG: hypothetical protein H0U61_06215 [Nocardioidaceae bacterium]|nr:hypothetical protein [Nocardioidaceae bacterium]
MSKERARRRGAREAESARKAEERTRQQAAATRRQARRTQLAKVLPSRRQSGGAGLLAAKRRRTAGLVLFAFFVVQFLTWVSTPDWGLRGAVLLVSVFAFPLLLAVISSPSR